MLGQAHLQPLAGLVRQFLGLGTAGAGVEARQDRIALGYQEGAAPRDVEGVVAGLGQVGEQLAHGLGRLEPVLVGDLAAVDLAQKGAVRDAQQGVVRLVHGGVGEIDVVGGHQRHVVGVGPFDQAPLGHGLDRPAVALQLDIEAVAEHRVHLGQGRIGLARLAGDVQRVDRPVRPT